MKKPFFPLCLVLILAITLMPGCDLLKGQLPVVNSFDANPPSISTGGSSTLTWNITGATAVSIDQGIGNVGLTGSRAVAPGATTAYILTATNATGSITATCQVMVAGTPSAPPAPAAGLPIVNSFTASPPGITTGGASALSWSVTDATAVTINPLSGTFATSGTTVVSPSATTTYTLTATNAVGSTTATVQVLVLSSGYTPEPSPSPAPVAFAVSSVTAMVDPPSFTGACPKNFTCSAIITASSAGTVTYRWERSDGGSSPQQTLVFPAAGSQMVTTGWPRTASGAYWVRVRTISPNEVLSNQASFNLTCSAPFAVTAVTVNVIPTSFTGPCPKNFSCSVLITVNGPGTVTYQWERSDGGISPPQTMTFAAAGTASGGTGWPRDVSGLYGVRVRTLMPNAVTSNMVMFQLTCE
jgi:hypothetical protein